MPTGRAAAVGAFHSSRLSPDYSRSVNNPPCGLRQAQAAPSPSRGGLRLRPAGAGLRSGLTLSRLYSLSKPTHSLQVAICPKPDFHRRRPSFERVLLIPQESTPRPVHNHSHADEAECHAKHIEPVWSRSVKSPAPQEREHDKHAAVGGIHTTKVRGLKCRDDAV